MTGCTESLERGVSGGVVGGGRKPRKGCAAFADKLLSGLQQTEFAGTGNRFSAPLDLKLAEDFLIVSFDRFQGEDQPLANLLIRLPLSDEAQNFKFTPTQRLDQGLDRGKR